LLDQLANHHILYCHHFPGVLQQYALPLLVMLSFITGLWWQQEDSQT
jgi:hypothetical protein